MQELFDLMKKYTVSPINNNMIYCIVSAIKKDYNKFVGLFLDNVNVDNKLSGDLYIIENCLFVIKDLDKIIKGLESLGYKINKEDNNKVEQSDSAVTPLDCIDNYCAQSDSARAFLDCIDNDYINYLFECQIDMHKKGFIKSNKILPRSRFHYNNIHKNLGNIKV